jgi:hypothetical protein
MQSVSQAIAKLNKATEQQIRGTIIGCASRIIQRTPVREGTLRGNWQASLNYANTATIDARDPDGSAAISAATAAGNSLQIGDTFYMTNNLPYAARIEFYGWSKEQAPEGMLRIEVQETAAAIRANRKL